MKRLLFISALFLCSLFTYAQLLGSGTEDDPYMIYTAEDLNEVRDYVGVEGVYFQLANDIDLSAYSEGEGWEPIGTQGTQFKGNFNGNSHTIKNLKIKRPETDYVGLFGYSNGSTINNLRIICDITGKSCVGAICGYASAGLFDNCGISGSVTAKSSGSGGLAGYSSSSIYNCKSTATIKGYGCIGGLIGKVVQLTISIDNCSVSGIINGTGNYCGGIIGNVEATLSITNCLFNGSIDGTSSYVGGILGIAQGSMTCSDCAVNSTGIKGAGYIGGICGSGESGYKLNVSKCDVTTTIGGSADYIGGIIGYQYSDLEYCNSHVIINATGSYIGGIAGQNYGGNITTCKAECTINSGNYVGGIAGKITNGTITNSNFIGSILGGNYVGGIAGYSTNYNYNYNISDITYCISNGNIEGYDKVGGICGYTDKGILQSCLAVNTEIKSSGSNYGRIGMANNYTNIKSNLSISTTKVYYGNSLITVTDGNNNGISYGPAILKMKSTYTDLGWDFDEIWDIDEGTSYPYLRYFNPTKTQNIVFETPALTYGDVNKILPMQTEQGLPISWKSSDEKVAIINGNTLIIKGAGNCYLIAEQAGNNIYKSIRETYPITIAKAPLTITADNFTRNIGENNPELTFVYSGFVYDEDETALLTKPSITTDATKDSPSGVYAITVSGAESNNYDITYVNGTLTIIDEATLRNTLAVTQTMLRAGKNATLNISLDNEDTMIAFEFFMQLPDGISIALDEDGYPDVTLNSARSNRHVLEVSQDSNSLYHFLCYSNSNNAIKGNSGELLSINIICDEEVVPEIYQGHIRNVKFSDNNENRIVLSNIDFDVEVSNVTMGDVNDDGDIDVMDVVMMVNYMMGRPSSSFVFAAADHTGDNTIDVMDLVRQVSLVMSQQASNAPAYRSFDAIDSGLSLVTDNDGSVNIHLADGKQYVATQYVVMLSEGQELLGISSDRNHIVSIQPLSDNRYFVMSYSMSNEAFADNDQTMTLHVKGHGTVSVEDATFVDINNLKVAFQSASTETTGINKTSINLSSPIDVYSINGILVKKGTSSMEELHNGMYIINGKKVIVK